MSTNQAGVKFGHAVHMVRANHGQMGHAYPLRRAFLDDGEFRLAGIVSGPATINLFQVPAIDLVDDFQMTRQDLLEKRYRPSL